MKATLDTKVLREALSKSKLAVARRTTLPITTMVRMESIGGIMILKSTDLESYITTSIPCKGDNFAACVPPRILSQFINKGDGVLNLEISPRNLLVKHDIGEAEIVTMEARDFPPPPDGKDIQWRTIDAKLFCRMATILLNGCCKEDSRPVLTGIHCKDGAMASADGFRLYVYKNEKLDFGLAGKEAIIPNTVIMKAVRLFSKVDKMEIGFHSVSATPNAVSFRSGDILLDGQVVQGTYPRYEQLIPVSFAAKISFSVPLMMERVEAIDPLEIPSLILRLAFTDKHSSANGQAVDTPICYLSSGNEETVRYHMELPVLRSGTESKIAVQLNYFKDAIKSFSMCNLELNNPSAPMKITGDIEGLTVLVMPMFVQW